MIERWLLLGCLICFLAFVRSKSIYSNDVNVDDCPKFQAYANQEVSICCVQCDRSPEKRWNCSGSIVKPERRATAWTFRLDTERVMLAWLTSTNDDFDDGSGIGIDDGENDDDQCPEIRVGRMRVNSASCLLEGQVEYAQVQDRREGLRALHNLTRVYSANDGLAYSCFHYYTKETMH
uniref:Secreted protein n=1 Tax=Trichogramma kaykai TaxID=54128 RepID=A0ABD2W3D8_9HYME